MPSAAKARVLEKNVNNVVVVAALWSALTKVRFRSFNNLRFLTCRVLCTQSCLLICISGLKAH